MVEYSLPTGEIDEFLFIDGWTFECEKNQLNNLFPSGLMSTSVLFYIRIVFGIIKRRNFLLGINRLSYWIYWRT